MMFDTFATCKFANFT